MKKLFSKTFNYFILFFMVLFFISGCDLDLGNGFNDKDETFKIGFFGPLTTEATTYGLSIRDVIIFSIYEINSNGGINGKKLELVTFGSKCSRVGGKLAIEKFIDEDINIVIGGICSDGTLGAAKLAEENNILLLTPTASAQKISEFPKIFRTALSVEYLGYELAEEAFRDGKRKVAMINEFSAYTESFKKYFTIRFVELGGEIVNVDVFDTFEDDLDFLYDNINSSDADSVVLIFQNHLTIKHIFSKFRNQNLDIPIYGGELIKNDLIAGEFYDVMENVKVVGVYYNESERYETFKKNSIDFIGFDVFLNNNPYYLIPSYELLYIFKNVVEGSNCKIDNVSCISNGLLSENFDSIFGNISFDNNGDVVLIPQIYSYKNKEFFIEERDQ